MLAAGATPAGPTFRSVAVWDAVGTEAAGPAGPALRSVAAWAGCWRGGAGGLRASGSVQLQFGTLLARALRARVPFGCG